MDRTQTSTLRSTVSAASASQQRAIEGIAVEFQQTGLCRLGRAGLDEGAGYAGSSVLVPSGLGPGRRPRKHTTAARNCDQAASLPHVMSFARSLAMASGPSLARIAPTNRPLGSIT